MFVLELVASLWSDLWIGIGCTLFSEKGKNETFIINLFSGSCIGVFLFQELLMVAYIGL